MKSGYSLFILVFVFIATSLTGQEKKADWRKLHYLSEEEMSMELDHARLFVETDPPVSPVRNVGEFEQMQAVMVRYPFGIPLTLVKEIADYMNVITIVANASEEQTVTTQYSNNGVNLENCSFMYAPTDSHWVRDYGAWFVFDGNNQPGVMDFPYNRPRPNDNNIPGHVANYLEIDLYGMNLIHTGGNYMTCGLGRSSSTELVAEENPTLSDEDIDSLVFHYLGIEDYYIIDDPLDEYIKHIDCWGKFLSPGKVLIGEVDTTDDRYDDFEAAAGFFKNTISPWGKPYEVFRVFTPGTAPNTPYTNSLIANDRVFVPITGSQWDDEAIDAYEVAMPGYEIVAIMYGGWYNTDALHCRAKGIADVEMLYIDHMPLLGTIGFQESYDLTAEFIAYSGEDVYSDSALIYYSIDGGEFTSSAMEWVSGDTWEGAISGISPGDHISYYLYGTDESGHRVNHPYIGEPDPHEFTAFGFLTDEIGFDPDTLVFLTYEDAIDGLPLQIINLKNDSVEILDITEEEYDSFFWYAEDLPDLPWKIGGHDTLTVQVFVGIPTNMQGEMLYDSLVVTTTNDTYHAIISVDSDLVTDIGEPKQETELNVFPNPFSDRLSFSVSIEKSGTISLSVYDLTGKLVFDINDTYNAGNHTINWSVPKDLKTGHYIYTLKFRDNSYSGKLILNR